MIPFDLAQFDEVGQDDHTASVIETSIKPFLGKAGLEREGAALLLSRLYMRQDTANRFGPFLKWAQARFENGIVDVFIVLGVLQVICEVVKSGSLGQIQQESARLYALAESIDKHPTFSSNTAIRKYKTKLLSRIAIRSLPSLNIGRRKGRLLANEGNIDRNPVQQNDIEVPHEVESVLEHLFNSLQDKDTVVRWSAAKGVAHISERLPLDFSDQIFETILNLFSIHSIAAASLYDLPAIAESTWHGACLACAEMTRRGLVAQSRLSELIEWLSKALFFDLRKGAHSIGSNVRDAAAYVIWALARSQVPSTLAPFSHNLAQRLTAVALYDREIHIRRAASAAFQEHVGRNNLFPCGIDVLGKTDFYAVSIRRNAFLVAAPQVAQHEEYQTFLLNHVLDVTLRHWDPTMRELGSQSLRSICLGSLDIFGPMAIEKSAHSIDVSDLHGGLLALSEIAIAYREIGDHNSWEVQLRKIFRCLAHIPFDVLIGPRNAIVTAAACRLISITVTLPELHPDTTSVPQWRKIVDHGLKHRTLYVQEAGADAMASLRNSSPTIQQSLGILIGAIDYSVYDNALFDAVACLLEIVKSGQTLPKPNIEARRNCYAAISRIMSTIGGNIHRSSFGVTLSIALDLSIEVVTSLFECLLDGLDDYSTDQRGDVGSWIRVACIQSLMTSIEVLIRNAKEIVAFHNYLPPSLLHSAVCGILKQGVERLDNVRQEAGVCFLRLLHLPLPEVHNATSWQLPGLTLLKELFGSNDSIGWNEASWLFPRAVRLLEVPEYRPSVLLGLVFSLGSKTESTVGSEISLCSSNSHALVQYRPLAASLISYVKLLPVTNKNNGYDLITLVEDLIARAKSNLASNVIVIPVLQTFDILLEGDALTNIFDDPLGSKSLQQLLDMTTKNISRIKSVPRIHECMKITVHLLRFQTIFEACVSKLVDFLGHQFPSIRSNSAEFMFNFLQGTDLGIDTDGVEEILLNTEWSVLTSSPSIALETRD
ncbi:Tubulin-specific chaperone D [Termitomyces sp. J132]|nr:Tubulin-specific chaperone D [Termitomyces sp. J132]